MINGYSFWASTSGGDSTQAITLPRRTYIRYGSKSIAENFTPSPLMGRVARENMAFLKKVAENSAHDAISVWLGAVSGKRLRGDNEASIKAGAKDQPDWDYLTIDWKNYGDRDQREALGNFNYGATGYYLGMKLCRNVGMTDDQADRFLRPVLRAGGGAYQFSQDFSFSFKQFGFTRKVDTTWYHEERKDVPPIEAGMDYAQFHLLREDAEKHGTTLNPRDFGFPDEDDSKLSVTDYNLEKEMGLEKLTNRIREELDRIQKQAIERRLRDEREVRRELEEREMRTHPEEREAQDHEPPI